ncbi:CAMK family protein kinase [Trichomonas vaginalis G3]|uniref:CAMK family protein kinase n=1 Tax=Trichomonas vaginalis (strain ATCC PRA-98 / G3) TaxID=412133 RepID=A2FSN5_TRIV3|nr:protein serine/threonine kinase protein [Trichomonas vaginalis G3]EAX92091.1 CAMK family protein kinase [Trichomonas vaginalis G3]KAI5550589.1 protein serine/threonine kinase protein [Trichomonas vaginalis G3]|eukprot:XP_001305021.1 CAMK family protein kinase [Trichomonas vaginalis G3]
MLSYDESFMKIKQLDLVETISSMKCGSVYIIRYPNCEKNYVLKSIPIEKFKQKDYDYMMDSTDVNTTKIYAYESYESNVYILQEFCPNTVDYMIRRQKYLNKELLVKHSIAIAKAVAQLHHKQKPHLNLKPSNILIDEDETIKLTDFGYPTDDEFGTCENEFLNSLPFLAPEYTSITKQDPYKADIWALGVIFYMMYTGRIPWDGISKATIAENVLKEEPNLDAIDNKEYADIIGSCLQLNPSDRPSIDDLLNVPLFKGTSATFIRRKRRDSLLMSPMRVLSHTSMIVQPVTKRRMSSMLVTGMSAM